MSHTAEAKTRDHELPPAIPCRRGGAVSAMRWDMPEVSSLVSPRDTQNGWPIGKGCNRSRPAPALPHPATSGGADVLRDIDRLFRARRLDVGGFVTTMHIYIPFVSSSGGHRIGTRGCAGDLETLYTPPKESEGESGLGSAAFAGSRSHLGTQCEHHCRSWLSGDARSEEQAGVLSTSDYSSIGHANDYRALWSKSCHLDAENYPGIESLSIDILPAWVAVHVLCLRSEVQEQPFA